MFNPSSFFQYGLSGLCRDINITYTTVISPACTLPDCICVSFNLDGTVYKYNVPKVGQMNGKDNYRIVDLIDIYYFGGGLGWRLEISNLSSISYAVYFSNIDSNNPLGNSWFFDEGCCAFNLSNLNVTQSDSIISEPTEVIVQKDSVINNKSSYLIDTSRLKFNIEQSRWELIESDQVFAYLNSTEKCPFGTYIINSESDTNLATFIVENP